MTFLVALALVIGLIGTVAPVIPGLTLMWAASLVYGLAAGFGTGGWVCFGVITTLAIAGLVAGIVLPPRQAGKQGAANASIALGIALALVGFFVVPIIGFFLGGTLGIYLGERVLIGRSHEAAAASTKATIIAMGVALVAQFAMGVAIIASWLVWVIAVH